MADRFQPPVPPIAQVAFTFVVFLLSVAGASAASGQQTAVSQSPYKWKSVAIHGGGFVAGIILHPSVEGLIYARTDVGGAYRWSKSKWIPLTDWVGEKDSNLMGCESIAVDTNHPDRLYMALGTYTNSWAGNGAIVRSKDRGNTFERTDVPFKMGGNDPGRSAGERLVVDPHDGNVLLFGSRADGLWKSSDQAMTWQRVESFPAVATSSAAYENGGSEWALGIVFVKFDPSTGDRGNPTPVIYTGISTQQASLYRSKDAGATWQPVPNQPIGFRPNHMVRSSAGFWYISYGDQAGPNEISDGAIWRFNPKDDQWTDITPVKPSSDDHFGYGAVTVDARHPQTLMASSLDRWGHGDAVFRSIDGGAHWSADTVGGGNRDLSRFDASAAPWANSLAPHWLGDIEIDPFDSEHALFVTGYGIWSTHNASALDSGQHLKWAFQDDGLEETVPTGLISPGSGPHLISVIGDFDGFTHIDLDTSPKHGRHQPSIGTTTGLDFAELNPKFVARAGGRGKGFYSHDGGTSWAEFTSTPPGATGGGAIAVSSDGNALVWTPDGTGAFRSSDLGSTWTACSGIPSSVRVIADRVNPKRFFAADVNDKNLYESHDGGSTFSPTSAQLPGQIGDICAVPGEEGEVWFCSWGHLLRSTDGLASVVEIHSVTQAYKIGFGKAAPGMRHPAIYLAGEVAGVTGLFRCEDGTNWSRIDDAAHQFGHINMIIGDPRVYGRVYVGTGGRGIQYGDISSTH